MTLRQSLISELAITFYPDISSLKPLKQMLRPSFLWDSRLFHIHPRLPWFPSLALPWWFLTQLGWREEAIVIFKIKIMRHITLDSARSTGSPGVFGRALALRAPLRFLQ